MRLLETTRVLAIDPGERHVGYVIMWGFAVIEVNVLEPDPAVQWFWSMLDNAQLDHVVIEQWRNYGEQVTWSECTTVEVIGAVKHKCLHRKIPCVKQPALIKRPGFARMRAHGFEMPDMSHIPTDQRGHARDAVVHGYWWLLEQKHPSPGLAEHHLATADSPLAPVSKRVLE